MKLVVTSDLHVDPGGKLTTRARIDALAQSIADEAPSLVVLAGDLGHTLRGWELCLDAFRAMPCPVAALAGNHDVWRDRSANLGSEALFSAALADRCARAGVLWLEEQTLRFGPIAVVGSMAWYDYSAVDPTVTMSAAQLEELKPAFNNDARFIDWPHRDGEVAARLGDALVAKLDALERDASITTVAVVTHVPLLEEQMERRPHDPTWGLCNAYFGNLTLGRRVTAFRKVRAVVSGHTHAGRRAKRGAIDIRVVDSDYGAPSYESIELSPEPSIPQ